MCLWFFRMNQFPGATFNSCAHHENLFLFFLAPFSRRYYGAHMCHTNVHLARTNINRVSEKKIQFEVSSTGHCSTAFNVFLVAIGHIHRVFSPRFTYWFMSSRNCVHCNRTVYFTNSIKSLDNNESLSKTNSISFERKSKRQLKWNCKNIDRKYERTTDTFFPSEGSTCHRQIECSSTDSRSMQIQMNKLENAQLQSVIFAARALFRERTRNLNWILISCTVWMV